MDPRTLIPENKHDLERANAAVVAGFPTVEPILAELLAWVQDFNWPVAQVLGPFLAAIGLPLTSHVRAVLHGDDDVWKYWVVSTILGSSRPLAEAFRAELERLACAPTTSEASEEVDDAAHETLQGYGWAEGK